MSVGSIIGGGVHLVRTQPKVVAVWAALYAVVTTLEVMASRPFMAAMMIAQQQAAARAAGGIKSPPAFPVAFGNMYLIQLLFSVFVVIAFAAAVRAVARPTGDRFAYLRFGMDELRLIGLGILLALLIVVAEIVGVLVVIVLAGLARFVIGQTAAIAVGVILGIVLFGATIYAQVRLSLAGAFTVLESRIVIKDAWRATSGEFWSLFGAYLSIGLLYLLFTIIVLAITSPQLLSAYASFNPHAMQAVAQQQYAAQTSMMTGSFVLRIILGAVFAVPMGVVLAGGIATAALELGGVRKTVAAEFE